MGLSVSLVDCISDYLLDSFRSKPWFTVQQSSQVCMCSEEWVKQACLVFFDEVVISWITDKAWKISTGEDHSGNSQGHGHLQIEWNVTVFNNAVSCPHSTISLRTEEGWSSKYKWTLLAIITFVKCLPRSLVHQSAICIMNPPMLHNSSVLCNMGVPHWHAKLLNLLRPLENWRLIHIIPSSI